MRRLPWHVALRADRRAAWTTGGIALAVAFALVGLAVPEGLRLETVSPEGALARQDSIVSAPGLAPFDPAPLGLPNATSVLLVEATLDGGSRVVLAALEGARAVDAAPQEARPNGPGGWPASVRLANGAELAVGTSVDTPYVPRGWLLVAPATARALDPALDGGRATYAIVPGLPDARADDLRARGFDVSAAPGVEPFFRASTAEVAQGLLMVVLFSCALLAVFSYEFLRAEARARRREIAVWRAVGMSGADVAALLVGRALALALAGTAVGLVAAAVLLVAAQPSPFLGGVAPARLAAILLAFLASALVGAWVPARAAARATIRSQMGAAP
ncbi:MAG TPA: FtsX-like permease family protein [Candidatus Thermoplasmatota archaeon]|nr:FtsX-like permease family protein [Candidatus Thermoplasmatota archaeon]